MSKDEALERLELIQKDCYILLPGVNTPTRYRFQINQINKI